VANCLPIGDAFIFFEKKGEERKGERRGKEREEEGRKRRRKRERERSEIDSTTNHDAKSRHCLSRSEAMTEIPTKAGVKTEREEEGRKRRRKRERERSEIDSTTNHDAKLRHCLSRSEAMTEIPTKAGVKTEVAASKTRVLTERSAVLKL
jgi:DNA-binding phage protein